VVLIATSDWIVLLLLGPNWADVSQIFAWLGIAALLQPICNTTGWLFMTQDRTSDMLRWGVIGSTITVIGIVIGLPWGAVGVAASYSLTYVCVVAPLVVWFVGRAGPVRASDVYRTVAPCGVAAVATLLVLYRVRQLEIVRGPIAGVAACLAIACVVTTAVLATMPAGRRTLRDLGDTALLVLRTRAHKRAHD
jgi:O-antigen/teichoic acid export membrane protein